MAAPVGLLAHISCTITLTASHLVRDWLSRGEPKNASCWELSIVCGALWGQGQAFKGARQCLGPELGGQPMLASFFSQYRPLEIPRSPGRQPWLCLLFVQDIQRE